MRNFDLLSVSYHADGMPEVDVYRVADIIKGISCGTMIPVRVTDMVTGKFERAECKAATKHTIDGFGVDLVFGPTDLNIKNKMEEGTLSLFWTKGSTLLEDKPDYASYSSAADLTTSIEVETSFLKHHVAGKKHFIFRDQSGKTTKKYEPLYAAEFKQVKDTISATDYERAYNYVASKVDAVAEEFSVGSLFPDPWHDDLSETVYKHLQNTTQAAYFLSSLVQTVLIDSDYLWTASKTWRGKRAFSTLLFCKEDKKVGF